MRGKSCRNVDNRHVQKGPGALQVSRWGKTCVEAGCTLCVHPRAALRKSLLFLAWAFADLNSRQLGRNGEGTPRRGPVRHRSLLLQELSGPGARWHAIFSRLRFPIALAGREQHWDWSREFLSFLTSAAPCSPPFGITDQGREGRD